MFICVIMLLMGVNFSKWATNAFTVVKVVLILFIIISGLLMFNSSNISSEFMPMGISGSSKCSKKDKPLIKTIYFRILGVMRGSTAAFFGYVGYDEVCCLAAEVQNPKRNVPLAVFGTVGICTVLYILASLALVGMVPCGEVNGESGFSAAFRIRYALLLLMK